MRGATLVIGRSDRDVWGFSIGRTLGAYLLRQAAETHCSTCQLIPNAWESATSALQQRRRFSEFPRWDFVGKRGLIDVWSNNWTCVVSWVVRTMFPAMLLATCLGSIPTARGDESSRPSDPAGGVVRFNRDIRPILSDNCFFCHGPDRNFRKADLRLDDREAAVDYGAIVPGKPEDSSLWQRIVETDPELKMPPIDSHKKLSHSQLELLRRWIAEGAVYEPHWAYIAPKSPPVPKVEDPRARIANPIDAFIQTRLLDEGIGPSPRADKRTLIRRVTLDLTGLPPTPTQVDAFVRDNRPEAYEKLVDQLLASPHYGERMASPWLDVVRYADTVGYHGDQNQNAWPYRDWVVSAFNRNQPFDQFTIEQIAGDLLPNPTTDQLVATCANRLNMVTREGGAQPKEYLAKYTADRVRTVSMAWLGSTMGCAECHDHKFDPFTSEDFYSMGAFFADVKQWGVYANYRYTPEPELKGVDNNSPFPPEIVVPSRYLIERRARLQQRMREVAETSLGTAKDNDSPRREFVCWLETTQVWLRSHPDGWQYLRPIPPQPSALVATAAKVGEAGTAEKNAKQASAASGAEGKDAAKGKSLPPWTVEGNGVVFTGKKASDERVHFELEPGWLASLSLDLKDKTHSAKESVWRTKSDEVKVAAQWFLIRKGGSQQAGESRQIPLKFRFAEATSRLPRYSSGREILGVHQEWKVSSKASGELRSLWTLERPIRIEAGDALVLFLPKFPATSVKVLASPLAPSSLATHGFDSMAVMVETIKREPNELSQSVDAPPRAESLLGYLLGTAWNKGAFDQVVNLEREVLECRDGKSPVLVTESVKPMTSRILPRGNWQDESGKIVGPAVPSFLSTTSLPADRQRTRLDLAHWLVSEENPLTARVFVNRLWKQFFGHAISAQPDDLGAQGEWPVHPELLDWLAVDFRTHGWDVRRAVKQIVMSETYCQSSSLRPEMRDRDPDNRLLSSQNPRRLEAEHVRDNALAIAGLLVLDQGGPPVKPYQPEGYYANLQFPDRPYLAERDERQYRRGLYVHWQRTFLHPMLANFDAPSREDCIAARNVANTPQQALTLLNDPTFVETARVFAELLLREGTSDTQRFDLAFERALARPIRPDEQAGLERLLANLRAEYLAHPEEARKLLAVGNREDLPPLSDAASAENAAWTNVCRVILNLQETITKY